MAEMSLRKRINIIIFEADTPAGKAFDLLLLVAIAVAVTLVMLQSVRSYAQNYSDLFWYAELVLSILFSLEYLLRLATADSARRYALSFFGIVDLAALVPFYFDLFFDAGASLATIRALRLLRIFLILKLRPFVGEGQVLAQALWRSRHKIGIFLGTVLAIALVVGTLMYVIEGDINPQFTNIPRSLYWAIVTMTTVGYGDIAPSTTLGQFFASVLMIAGYAIIAVPTGIVSAELVSHNDREHERLCKSCGAMIVREDARFCRRCGVALETAVQRAD